MKKLIFICFFTFCYSFNTKAQTIEETIEWLTEKMLKPGFLRFGKYGAYGHYGSGIAEINKVQFDGNFLSIQGSSNYDVERNGKVVSRYQNNFGYSIDLSKVTTIHNDYLFYTSGNNINRALSSSRFGWQNGDFTFLDVETTSIYNSRTDLNIVSDIEPDILQRFKKAIEHYKSLMIVKKSDEKF